MRRLVNGPLKRSQERVVLRFREIQVGHPGEIMGRAGSARQAAVSDSSRACARFQIKRILIINVLKFISLGANELVHP